MSKIVYDLTNLSLPKGTYTVRVKAGAEGYEDSEYSPRIELTVYSISYTNITNGTATGQSTAFKDQELTFTIEANTGYTLPPVGDIHITNADITDYEESGNVGTVTIANIRGDVVVSAACPAHVFDITANVTNGTYSGATSISAGGVATASIAPSASYTYPAQITVNGVTGTSGSVGVSWAYNSSFGTITFSNPTDNITVSATCTLITYTVSIAGDTTHYTITRTGGDTPPITPSQRVAYEIVANNGYCIGSTASDMFSVMNASLEYYTRDNTYSSAQFAIHNPTGNVVIYVNTISAYSITANITNGTYSGDGYIAPYQGAFAQFSIEPNQNYEYPATVIVTNATLYQYDPTDGTGYVLNPSGNVTITATCEHVPYTITANITNGSYSGSGTISPGGSVTGTIVPDTNYRRPINSADVVITGANMATYNPSNGQVIIAQPTDNITITATCPRIQYTITTVIGNGTYSGDSTIYAGGTASGTVTPDTNYVLPNTITVTNATATLSAQGVLSISNPTGNVTIEVECVLNKLSTPTNISVTNTTATCDDVQYATTYEYYVDDVLLGSYTPNWAEQDGDDLTIERVYNVTQSNDNIIIQ